MIDLHAIWQNTGLHIFGRYPDGDMLSQDQLRQLVGDSWDGLLVSAAVNSSLTLRLPQVRGSQAVVEAPAAPAQHAATIPPDAGWRSDGEKQPDASDSPDAPPVFVEARLPVLLFSPAEAVDLLSTGRATDDIRLGTTFRYWARVTGILLELLARQRFVPSIHASRSDYRGYWRIVLGDDLIASMPPVCRAGLHGDTPAQSSDLVENFLWTCADAIVRRCLEGDELVRITHERQGSSAPMEMRWLRSLVSQDPSLDGAPEEQRGIQKSVHQWTSKLEPIPEGQTCRTCLQLHSPPEDSEGGPWWVTAHVQALDNPTLVIDATMLWEDESVDPRILQRPFANAKEKVTADIEHAAKHLPALASCLDQNAAYTCELTLSEAYTFLRDVAPVLTLEGFGIWLPRWWRDDRPRLQLELDIRPPSESSVVEREGVGFDTIVSYDWRVAIGDVRLSKDEIDSLANARESLVKLRGQWVEVQPDDLKAAIRFSQDHREGQMTVLESLRYCYLSEHHDTGLPIAGIKARGWIENLLESTARCDSIEPLESPDGFQGKLRPYQLTGMRWMSFLTRHGLGACLADDMGLGKTIQLISLLLHEKLHHAKTGPTLLIVPMSLVGNWRREIERFAPALRAMVHHGLERLSGQEFVEEVARHDVVISTYGLTHRDLNHLAEVQWYRVALDEAQNIKNPAAKQSRAIRSLRSVHRIALTGTPVENRLSELWAIVEFLNPAYLGTARDFRRRFAVPIERERDQTRAKQLRKLIQPFVLRRKKDDPAILEELPPKMEMQVYCNLTREQAVLYERIVGEMLGQIEQAGGIQRRGLILATLTKLKQICNHPVHYNDDGGPLLHRSGKCDRLSEMLEEVIAEGDRALVFTQFRAMGHLLKRHLHDTLEVDPYFLHGGMTQKERDRLVETFQNGEEAPSIFILSLKAGGFGLNLTRANHVFHYDRWWNPAVEDQATDRVHRIGQHKQVQVHRFVCMGTLEERIDSLIQRKRALAEKVVGSGEDWLTELSTDALREIFALSRDAVAED
ncbi:MAG: DEAD/DEAH box helicase [Phycisphaerae bacterium]